jgi:hypothetical protein
MTSSFAGLDDLNLLQHGDVRERDLWPMVSGALSQYEPFWRALIVLLSNRIEPSVRFEDPAWIQARSTIPCAYEQLAMHNYSLFYFSARARQAIDEDGQCLEAGNYPHPETAFFLLQAAVDHAKGLQLGARNILRHLGLRPEFPKHPEDLYRTIGSYRNAFTHNPVLGRAINQGRELLPPETWLPKKGDKNLMWSDIARIPMSEMIDGLKLEEDLWGRLSAFLQKQWEVLTGEFVQARQCDKFIADLGLAVLLPIRSATLSTLTMGASGTSGASGAFSSGWSCAGHVQ